MAIRLIAVLLVSSFHTLSVFANGRVCRAFVAKAKPQLAHANPLKFYLTTNLTFPQSIDAITIALTAARILDQDAWETFHNLPKPDVKKAWSTMTRAHRAHDIYADIDQKRVELLLHEFVYRAGYAEMSMTEFVGDILGQNEDIADRRRQYSEVLLELLMTQTILDYAKQIREAASKAESEKLLSIVDAIKAELRQGLETRFPELAVPFYRLRPQYRRISRDHTVAKLLIEAFAFNLEPEVYGR